MSDADRSSISSMHMAALSISDSYYVFPDGPSSSQVPDLYPAAASQAKVEVLKLEDPSATFPKPAMMTMVLVLESKKSKESMLLPPFPKHMR